MEAQLDRPTPQSIGRTLAPLKADQLPRKIREEIENWSKNYGLGEFDMTFTDAVGAVKHVEWDGQNPPVFTLLQGPKTAA